MTDLSLNMLQTFQPVKVFQQLFKLVVCCVWGLKGVSDMELIPYNLIFKQASHYWLFLIVVCISEICLDTGVKLSISVLHNTGIEFLT